MFARLAFFHNIICSSKPQSPDEHQRRIQRWKKGLSRCFQNVHSITVWLCSEAASGNHLHPSPSAPPIRRVRIRRQQQRDMMMPLPHHEINDHLREKSVPLAPVFSRVEPQLPSGALAAAQLGEHVVERVGGDLARGVGARVGQPGCHAAVIVGAGLEGGRVRGGRRGEADADAAGGGARLRVEDVAGDAVLGGHCLPSAPSFLFFLNFPI
ncbi:hypothetical protein VUR80DRAFT_6002 [Thermomyces stellatus]